MKLLAITLIVGTLALSVIGCSPNTSPQSASPAELERYLRDNPVSPADDIYEVE